MNRAVREALKALQEALGHLADDLSVAQDPETGVEGEFETMGRLVLQVSAGLAQALVDWLEPMDLTYGDLDQVLEAIAAREPELQNLSGLAADAFEFLRKISYAGGPDPHDAPDMEDFSILLEEAVGLLEEKVTP